MYNYKALRYADGTEEYRYYSEIIYTGEKKRREPRELFENPFNNNELEYIPELRTEEEEDRLRKRSEEVSKSRTMQKIYAYARANLWDYFLTLTFNPDKVNRFDFGECQKKLTKWLNHLREDYPGLKYLFVPELHLGDKSETDKSGNHAWHFHGLVSGLPESVMVDSGHKTKSGLAIYNVGKYKLGWSTATQVGTQEACCKYITKYITKDLCEVTKGRKRYWASRNLALPEETTAVLDYTDLMQDIESTKQVASSCKEIETFRGTKRTVTTYLEVKCIDS